LTSILYPPFLNISNCPSDILLIAAKKAPEAPAATSAAATITRETIAAHPPSDSPSAFEQGLDTVGKELDLLLDAHLSGKLSEDDLCEWLDSLKQKVDGLEESCPVEVTATDDYQVPLVEVIHEYAESVSSVVSSEFEMLFPQAREEDAESVVSSAFPDQELLDRQSPFGSVCATILDEEDEGEVTRVTGASYLENAREILISAVELVWARGVPAATVFSPAACSGPLPRAGLCVRSPQRDRLDFRAGPSRSRYSLLPEEVDSDGPSFEFVRPRLDEDNELEPRQQLELKWRDDADYAMCF